jgi:hypothetical protein
MNADRLCKIVAHYLVNMDPREGEVFAEEVQELFNTSDPGQWAGTILGSVTALGTARPNSVASRVTTAAQWRVIALPMPVSIDETRMRPGLTSWAAASSSVRPTKPTSGGVTMAG